MAQTETVVDSAMAKAGRKPAAAASRSATLPLPLTSDRVSFELSEEAMESLRVKLVSTPGLGAFGLRGSKPTSIHSPAHVLPDAEYANWQRQHPCMLKGFNSFAADSRGKRLAVFLDYDGTLTPIVKDPDRAYMSDQMRDIVRRIATMFPTAIISGRGREKVQSFVKLQELFYAGSHGMDISGPQDDRRHSLEQLAFRPAARFEPIMQEVFRWLQERIKSIPGASVEDNKFCVSVHFRNCEEEAWSEVQEAVAEALQMQPEMRLSRGRKVLELRPEVEWDKGHAVDHLLCALGLGSADDVVPLYIGDDRTDEDAFRLLARRTSGFGILVSSRVKPTEAKFTLQDPTEVMTFLERLVTWGASSSNGWHSIRGCIGWKLTAPGATSAHAMLAHATSAHAVISYATSAEASSAEASSAPAPTAVSAPANAFAKTRTKSGCLSYSSGDGGAGGEQSARANGSRSSGSSGDGSNGILASYRSGGGGCGSGGGGIWGVCGSPQREASAAAAAALGLTSSGGSGGPVSELKRLSVSPFGEKLPGSHANGSSDPSVPCTNGYHTASE